MSDKVKLIIKIVAAILAAVATALGSVVGLTSCNVTRTITSESSVFHRGDTSVTINTRTIEMYDASRKGAQNSNNK